MNMIAPTYREARCGDAAAITTFQIAMARETEDLALDVEVCRKGVLAVFEAPAKGRYFVAELGGRVVASLMITYEWSDWRNGNFWWFQSVYVLPEYRGRKLFSGLYAYIKALAASDPSVRGLRLYVEKKNHSAQKIYAALGMSDEHYALFEWMKLS